jgi:hypothetical protein
VSINTILLGVTADLAKDINELNFCYSNDWSYETSHCGLSLFAVVGVFMATASKWCLYADRFSWTSNLTLAEVALAEMRPDALP